LAIKGGFEIEKWLYSASTNLIARIGGKKIEKGDSISLKTNPVARFETVSRISLSESLFGNKNKNQIRIIEGNEFQFLTRESQQNLENQDFTISKDANRMGYKLASEPLKMAEKIELLSSAVDFGTIQLLPNGQLIILMADHQTTGGYPRIGNVISIDLQILAQKSVGESFKFKIISIEEAEALFLENERDLMRLKVGVELLI
jgi:antagonist of KipI